jgi:hypothetical protein
MNPYATIEFFKKLNGIESIKIKQNDIGRHVETVAGNLHIPTQIDFNRQLYVRCFGRGNYFLSNDGNFSYDLIKKGLSFAEVEEGLFKINNIESLEVFCEMNNCIGTLREKLSSCHGDFISLAHPWDSTYLLHPFIASKEASLDFKQFCITQIDDFHGFWTTFYIFPKQDKIQMPGDSNINKLKEAISRFKPDKHGRPDYYITNNFSETIKYNSVYKGLTYQEVVLRNYSLDYVFFCMSELGRFNFNLKSKLLGSFSLDDFTTTASFESTKMKFNLFKELSELKDDNSVTLQEYVENMRDDFYSSYEPEPDIDEMIKDGLDDAFNGDSFNIWNID